MPTLDVDEINQLPVEQQIAVQTVALIELIKKSRPNDRSDLDREYAIAITKARDLYAHINTYILEPNLV